MGQWTQEKANFFETYYRELKSYEVGYRPPDKDLGIHKRRTNRAPFENQAIDIAEYDKAIRRLERTEIVCLVGQLYGIPVNDMAFWLRKSVEDIYQRIEEARAKLAGYLKNL